METVRRTLTVILVIGITAVMGVGCGALERPGQVHSFELDADDFFFEPAALEVAAGDGVTVRIRNIGITPHNFVIDDVVETAIIDPGETVTSDFEAPEAGTYEYYCSVPGHRELGMVGTLTVGD